MKLNFLNNKYFLFALRLLLGFVFIYAAVFKATDPAGFSQSIANYKLLPDFTVNMLSIVLPWIELSAGLFLIFGLSVKENSVIVSSLLIIFIIAIGISLIRGLDISCGCFGTQDGTKVGFTKLAENLGLLIAALILIKFNSSFLSITTQQENKNESLQSSLHK
jgi:uncharacterized membrane protein YphA (DoxX/SURF4 family)